MKTKYRILLLLISGIFFSGCDNFLDLAPPTQLSVATYYKTAEQIEYAVNGAYSTLQTGNMYGNWYVMAEIPSDNTTNVLSGSVTDQDEFDKYYIKTTNPYLSNFWNESYKGINKCNTVLDKIDAVDMDATQKEQFKMEMKFLRGLMYFNLVRVYDGVPLVIQTTDVSTAYGMARNSRDEVYQQIIADFTAAENLPASYAGNDVGRATKGAAKAMLGKVYMTLNDYPKAGPKLKEVIDLGQYALLENDHGSINAEGYLKIFDPLNHNHKESIFDVQFKKGGYGEGSNFPNNYAPQNSGTSVVPVGGTSGNNLPTEDMYEAYEDNDFRRDISMATSYVNSEGETIEASFVTKYKDTPYQNNDANNNFPVIRYADVLLMYAEVLNENNNTPEACTYLNQVRRRGFGYQTNETSPYDINTTDKNEFKLKVEQERRVELAFECHRWFDLIRTGRAVEVMSAKGFKLDATNLLCPIPQTQIDLNPNVLTQNTYTYH